MSSYRRVIDQTTQTMNRRMKNFRYLAISVICVGLVCIIWAGVSRALYPLTGLLLIVILCGLYLIFDLYLLNKWRQDLLADWAGKKIDFNAFCDAVTAGSSLPKESVQGMLATLPPAKDLIVEQGISSQTRNAIALVIASTHQNQYDRTVFQVIAWTITLWFATSAVLS